jgi:hypothetical protein
VFIQPGARRRGRKTCEFAPDDGLSLCICARAAAAPRHETDVGKEGSRSSRGPISIPSGVGTRETGVSPDGGLARAIRVIEAVVPEVLWSWTAARSRSCRRSPTGHGPCAKARWSRVVLLGDAAPTDGDAGNHQAPRLNDKARGCTRLVAHPQRVHC